MNKKIIRKLILEEVEKKLLNEVAWYIYALGAAAVAAAGAGLLRWYQKSWNTIPDASKVEKILTGLDNENLFEAHRVFIEELENNNVTIDMPSDSELERIAKELDENININLFGWEGYDYSTNYEEIKRLINECGSQIAVSKMAELYFNKYKPDLYTELFSEGNLTQIDQDDIMKTILGQHFIIINGQGYNQEQFQTYLEQAQPQAPQNTQPVQGAPVASTPSPTPSTSPIASQGGVGGSEEQDTEADTEEENKTRENCVAETPFRPPYVKNIAKAMNEYNEKNNIDNPPWKDDKKCPVDDNWSDEMQNFWLGYILHVFSDEEGCDLFNEYGFTRAQLSDWTKISRMLIGEYPRYTRNPKGCLAFVLDTICCKIVYGMQQPDRSTPARTSTGRTSTRPDVSIPSAPDSGRRSGRGNRRLEISLGQTGDNFTDTGFKHESGRNPDEVLKEIILNNINRRAAGAGLRPGTMQFYMYLDGEEVNKTSTIRFTGDLADLKPIRNQIQNQLTDFGRRLIYPTGSNYNLNDESTFDSGPRRRGRRSGQSIRVTVTFTGGRL